MLRHNIRYKLLALAIALVIWAYVNGMQNPTVSKARTLKVEVCNIDPGYVKTTEPKPVRILLEIPRAHANSIAAGMDDISAYVNLQGKRAGLHIVPVKVRLPASFPDPVNILAVPSKVPVTLEEKARRTFKVNVKFTGSPPVGYRFGTPQVSPGKVIVSGIARKVDTVNRLVVAVDPGDLSANNIDNDFLVVAQDRYGRQVQGVELIPKKAHVRLELLEAPASRAVYVSLDAVGQPPFPCRVSGIDVYPQTVTLTGRPERLMNITTLKTKPVKLTNRTRTFSQRVSIIAPMGCGLADGKSVRVTVRIESPAPKSEGIRN